MRKERKGMKNTNIYNEEYIVKEYINNENVYIYFPAYNYTRKVSWRTFEKGKIATPYSPTIYNHGFIGEGRTWKDNPEIYRKWQGMLRRCYDINFRKNKPTYENCTVCDEWLNYQNFLNWYEENYYEIPGETMHLDKDILIKGNKEYGPNTCIIVPCTINSLFTKTDSKRGDLPIGVDYHNNKYRTTMNVHGKHIHIGMFDTPEEAFIEYKKQKEKYIKEIADSYKEKIPEKLYNAMYEYEIEWED